MSQTHEPRTEYEGHEPPAGTPPEVVDAGAGDAVADVNDGPAETSEAAFERPIVARASRGFNAKWVVAGLVLVAVGAWFAYDGWVAWPAETAEYQRLTAEIEQASANFDTERAGELQTERDEYSNHNDTSILLQRVLGFLLPLMGLAVIAWTLYEARGELVLDDQDVLHAPGHPPVPLTAVQSVDDSRWDRKGKSFVTYEVDGKTGTLKLDDFVRERPPTDAIHDLVVGAHKLNSEAAT